MEEINKLRNQIDIIDQMLVKQFCDRLKVCEKIGEIKKANDIPIEDLEREQAVVDRLADFCSEVDYAYVKSLYKRIFTLCKGYEKEQSGKK